MEVDLLNCNKADIYSASGPLLCNARVHWDSADFSLLLSRDRTSMLYTPKSFQFDFNIISKYLCFFNIFLYFF